MSVPMSDSGSSGGFPKIKPLYYAIAAGALVLLMIISIFVSYNNTQKAGVAWENRVGAMYQADQNELSSYVSTIEEQAGLAATKTAALDKVLNDAVRGRYDNNLKVAAVPGKSNALISALGEAYPNLSGIDIYDKVADSISAGRQAFKDKQNQMLDMIRGYKTWLKAGVWHKFMVGLVGYPSSGLEARVNGQVLHGQAALDQMETIVLAPGIGNDFQTGQQAPLNLGPSTSAP